MVNVATCHVSGVMFLIRVGPLNSPLIVAVNAAKVSNSSSRTPCIGTFAPLAKGRYQIMSYFTVGSKPLLLYSVCACVCARGRSVFDV